MRPPTPQSRVKGEMVVTALKHPYFEKMVLGMMDDFQLAMDAF